MKVLVTAWIGSENLGDELVFSGLLRRLRTAGVAVTAASIDPPATTAAHGVEAVPATDPRAVFTAIGHADAVLLGGGGLLQDETSPFNLPFHLSRPWLARLRRRPVAGIGLGAGRLDTRLGRSLVRSALRPAVAVSVRDRPSAALLRAFGVRNALVGADLALDLPNPRVEVEPFVAVSLRPWTGQRGRRPVARSSVGVTTPEWFFAETAAALDRVSSTTGLPIRLVALEGPKDDAVHRAVADRMTAPVSTSVPALGEVVDELARATAVVAMRYHAAIAAVLGGRPAVLIGYSPKVDALAAELGRGGALVPWSAEGLAQVPSLLDDVMPGAEDVVEARERLRERNRVHAEVVERLAAAVGD
jgi:polysaccharide pyruvyl transferase CsaB